MTLERFFDKFEVFADVSGAVGKVRAIVYRLAVTGLLSRHEQGDEDVSVLLNSLRTRTTESIGQKRSGNQQLATPITVPDHWAWVALNQLGRLSGGMTPSMAKPAFWSGGVNWFSSKDIKADEIYESEMKISQEGLEATGLKLYPPGSLFIVGRSGILKRTLPVAINRAPATANQDLKVLVPFIEGTERYLQVMFKGLEGFILTELVKTGMTVQSLKYDEFAAQVFPFPPLAEQKRIVAKVDELMTLCDRWEAQLKERADRNAALAKAALARFTADPTSGNLEYLFHEVLSVDTTDLRKTILTLAVRGKLVEQESVDESVQAFLDRAQIAQSIPLENTDHLDTESFPGGWKTVAFGDLAIIAGGVTLGRKSNDKKTITLPYLRVANVKRGEVDLAHLKEVTILETEIERFSLQNNDLLLTEGGDWDKVGRTAIWRGQVAPCLHQNHIFRARLKSPELFPSWFERYLNSPIGQAYFQASSKQTTNLASINMRQVRGCPIPLPPLAEQKRIVAKVDELMALVDRLEALQTEARKRGAQLLEAAVEAVLNAPAVAPAEVVPKKLARAALSAEIVHRLYAEPTFGRVKHQKLLFLCEHAARLPEIEGNYHRDVAGPLDNELLYANEAELEAQGWYAKEPREISKGHRYHPLAGAGGHRVAFQRLWAGRREVVDRLIDTLQLWDSEKCELLATLFAAWNDLILWNRPVTDDTILVEVLERWNASKTKFSRERWLAMLGWMKAEGWVPTGFGRATTEPGLGI